MLPMSSSTLELAVKLLKNGRLVAFPTETVYGLGGDAKNIEAVKRIFSVKKRPADHPLIVHVPNLEQFKQWSSDLTSSALALANHFWPGPLTLIVKRASFVSDVVTGNQDTIGLRIPRHPIALELLNAFGGGIAAPSANSFGYLSPTEAYHVNKDLNDAVDLIIEGGPCEFGIESTIVDCTQETPRILRLGAIDANQINKVLGVSITFQKNNVPKVSGNLESHYSPRTLMKVVESVHLENVLLEHLNQGLNVAVVVIQTPFLKNAKLSWIQMSSNPQEYAKLLYATFHKIDQENHDLIIVEAVPNREKWLAIKDRLEKAALIKP